MIKLLSIFVLAFLMISQVNGEEEKVPKYLYKVLSLENWKNSQGKTRLSLPVDDNEFIHLSKEDQLQRLIDKYWSNESLFVVLKIETSKLPGNLVYEANPGGVNKYFHLYNGYIPKEAIVDVKPNKND